MNLLVIPLAVIATLMGAGGATLLKLGCAGFKPLNLLKNYHLLAGLGLYGLASLVFISALKLGELSAIYPLTSLSYIWVSIISFSFLKERCTTKKWIGVSLIIVGVVLMSLT